MHSGVLHYSTRVDINCERANDLCARKTASRARKLPQRAQNSLSRAQITSARAKPLAKDVFTLSLEFNFGTMGEGTKAGRYVKRPNVIGHF